jgi:long-subunit fatty acid transport protein
MKKIAIIIISFLLPAFLFAQTAEEAVLLMENSGGIGAKSQAMGNAFQAVADDYTATFWNPAGLTQLDDHEISADLYHLNFSNEATYLGNTIMDDRNFTKFSSIGLAYRFPTTRGSFVLGFGYNRIKDFDDFLYFDGFSRADNGLEFELDEINGEPVYYPFNQDVFRTEQVTQEGNLSAWAIGGGVELSPNFAVGLTVNIYSGSSLYLFDFFQDDTDNLYTEFPANYDSYELHRKIDSEFSGWGLKVGSLLHLNQHVKMAFTIDFPTELNVLETHMFDDVLYFDDGYISEYAVDPAEWEYVIRYPFKFGGGLALNLNNLLISGSFEYSDWTQVEFDKPKGFNLTEDYALLFEENNIFPEDFRSVISYAVGGEFRIPGTSLRLRGGYRYVPSPFDNADEEFDRKYFSTGFGYDIDKRATLNFSYTKGQWKRNSFDSFTPEGTWENINATRILAGITYRL